MLNAASMTVPASQCASKTMEWVGGRAVQKGHAACSPVSFLRQAVIKDSSKSQTQKYLNNRALYKSYK